MIMYPFRMVVGTHCRLFLAIFSQYSFLLIEIGSSDVNGGLVLCPRTMTMSRIIYPSFSPTPSPFSPLPSLSIPLSPAPLPCVGGLNSWLCMYQEVIYHWGTSSVLEFVSRGCLQGMHSTVFESQSYIPRWQQFSSAFEHSWGNRIYQKYTEFRGPIL